MRHLAALLVVSAVLVGCITVVVPEPAASRSTPTPTSTPIIIATTPARCIGHPVNAKTGITDATTWTRYDACFTPDQWAKFKRGAKP